MAPKSTSAAAAWSWSSFRFATRAIPWCFRLNSRRKTLSVSLSPNDRITTPEYYCVTLNATQAGDSGPFDLISSEMRVSLFLLLIYRMASMAYTIYSLDGFTDRVNVQSPCRPWSLDDDASWPHATGGSGVPRSTAPSVGTKNSVALCYQLFKALDVTMLNGALGEVKTSAQNAPVPLGCCSTICGARPFAT